MTKQFPSSYNQQHCPDLQGEGQGFGIKGLGGQGFEQQGTGSGLGQALQQGILSQQQLVKVNATTPNLVIKKNNSFTKSLQKLADRKNSFFNPSTRPF